MLLTMVLCIWIRPAADDFYYSTLGDGGWQAFLKNNLEHYQNYTGRVFVHLVLYPLLCLDMWPLRGFVVMMVGGCSIMAARLADADRAQTPLARVAALSIFWLMGIEVLQDSALWGAGALNYLFPMCLVLAYTLMIQRALEGRGGLWMAIPAFCCASTVEMTGIIPCVIFVYLCLTNWKQARARWRTLVILGLCTLAGYLFLFSSSGVAVRLEDNIVEVTFIERMLNNYALIDRRVIGPEGIWAVTALTLLSSSAVLHDGRSRWSIGMLLLTVAVLLTGLGIIYDGVAVALIAICAFGALAAFAVMRFQQGDRRVPLWMLCITVSLGICLVSPVMGGRLLMPTAVMMLVICVCNLVQLRLNAGQALTVAALLTIAASVILVNYTVHFVQNARVIDENTRIMEAHTEGTLVMNMVPDERYCGAAVPVSSGFRGYYLKHHGLTGTECAVQDLSESDVLWNGKILEEKALLRDGIWYLPVRAAGEIPGCEVTWEMASAVVRMGERDYCFHLGNYVANLGHGITGSVKLSGPVRNVSGKIYIPVSDFSTLFGMELTVQQMKQGDLPHSETTSLTEPAVTVPTEPVTIPTMAPSNPVLSDPEPLEPMAVDTLDPDAFGCDSHRETFYERDGEVWYVFAEYCD